MKLFFFKIIKYFVLFDEFVDKEFIGIKLLKLVNCIVISEFLGLKCKINIYLWCNFVFFFKNYVFILIYFVFLGKGKFDINKNVVDNGNIMMFLFNY